MKCHVPPLLSIPEGKWKCCECLAPSFSVSACIVFIAYKCQLFDQLHYSSSIYYLLFYRDVINAVPATPAYVKTVVYAYTVWINPSMEDHVC